MLLAPEETALLELDDQLRRSACDRCRCQKLRCERPGTGSGPGSEAATSSNNAGASSSTGGPLAPCRRCQRVGAVCNTSFQQRPGRPRTSDDSSSRGARRTRARRAAAHSPANSIHHSQHQHQQQSIAAAAAAAAAAASSSSSHRPEMLWAEQEELLQATQARHTKSQAPVGMQQSHVSRGSGGPGASSSGPATSTERGRTTTAGEDYSEFWTSCSNDMLPSWGWNGEDLSGLISTNKDTPSLSSAGGVASLDDELAGATVTQTSPPDIEIHPPQGDHRRDLYRQLADLSHTLSQDAQGLASSSLGADLDLKHVGSSCIQRAFKCLEALKSLTDELRIKTQHSLQALPQADVLLTPNSDWSRTGVFFTEKDADHLGRSCQTGPGTTTTADVRPGTDRHLDMIMSLHIVTSYVCLNQILKRTLGSILAAVVSQQKGGGDGSGSSSTEKPLLLWPDIQIEGLTGDGDNLLRVRLFAETCLHVATGIHKRLESLTSAAKDTMGSSLSRPMMMVLGGGGDSLDELDVDIRGIKLLCSQISSAVEERAW